MISLARKNIFRNKRRSLLSGIVIALAACSMSLLISIEEGLLNDMTNNVINHMTGTVRVRNGLYTQNERIRPLQFYIPDALSVIDSLKSVPGIADVQPRMSMPVTLYRQGKTSSVNVLGIDLQTSRLLKERNTQLISGELPNTASSKREVLVCEGLANHKGLKIGDKFTFMTKTASGGMNGVTVTVSGIISVSDSDFNTGYFFMDWQQLSDVLRMDGGILELQVFADSSVAENRVETELIPRIQKACGFENAEAIFWQKTSILYSTLQMARLEYAFISIFFFLLSATVIFVTTMMSVLERKRETGMLMALGMDSGSIFRLFLSETALISFAFSLVGVGIGFAAVLALNKNGLDISMLGGDAVSGFNYSQWIYPSLDPSVYIMLVAMGTIISTAACIIPVNSVRKIEPAEALHTAN